MSQRVAQLESEFYQLGELLINNLEPGERLWVSLESETSHFVRFNAAKVRQAGTVSDGAVKLRLIYNQRRASATFPLTGDLAVDSANGLENLNELRQEVEQLPEDPHIVLPEDLGSSREVFLGNLLPAERTVDALLSNVQTIDFTGFYVSGTVIRAHMNSAGQKHWFVTDSFCLDYSMIAPSEKAVKATLAGRHWQQEEYQHQIEQSKLQLQALDLPTKIVQPGRYRTYFAPNATAALVNVLARSALSESAFRQGGSALGKLREGKYLSQQLHLQENFSQGTTPRFNQFGRIAPEKLPLIVEGRLVNTLVNARTAKEYNITPNGANDGESLRAAEVSAGTLPAEAILDELGTGLYLSNLHYLNWSDRVGGRITGMTRYACFWVEDGKVIAPISNLRFDESLYLFFGEKLLAFTDFQEFIPNTSTYNSRQLGGSLVPGMLVQDFTFTL